jgi:hypothetical protein
MSFKMRTAEECLAKASEMEDRARQCGDDKGSIEYLALAKSWRYVAEQAEWQDSPKYAAFSGSLH